MKTQRKLYLLAVGAAALSLTIATSSGQVFSHVDALNNRAVAASPRAKEAFPWLTRSSPQRIETCCAANELIAVKNNRVFATSPRMLEQFPDLARSVPALQTTDNAILSTVVKNRGWASSPRAKEQYPWLARGNFKVTQEPFSIAPLK
jgi:hypothetical protein